ncbi:MAG: GIY-YIG nuclease family protein [Pseudomonadota bacterium]
MLLGSSVDLPAMLNRFRAELKTGSCRNKVLQKEWEQFGPEAFEFNEFELLEPARDNPAYDPADDIRILEELWLEKLAPFGDKGYNKPPRAGAREEK